MKLRSRKFKIPRDQIIATAEPGTSEQIAKHYYYDIPVEDVWEHKNLHAVVWPNGLKAVFECESNSGPEWEAALIDAYLRAGWKKWGLGSYYEGTVRHPEMYVKRKKRVPTPQYSPNGELINPEYWERKWQAERASHTSLTEAPPTEISSGAPAFNNIGSKNNPNYIGRNEDAV